MHPLPIYSRQFIVSAHCQCWFHRGDQCQPLPVQLKQLQVICAMQGATAGRWVPGKEEFQVDAFGLMAFAGTSSGRHPWTETFWQNESSPSQRGRGPSVRLAVNSSISQLLPANSLRPQKDERFQVGTWFHFSVVKMMEIATIFQSVSLANGDWCFPPAWNC